MLTDAEVQRSLAFYLALGLLGGQFTARVALGIDFDSLFLIVTAAIVLGVLFGPSFVIAFFRVILRRPEPEGDGGGDDDA